MCDCCDLHRRDVVGAYKEQTRAYATLGLLRHVTDATPLDMVCAYIVNTRQPQGLNFIAESICGRWKNESERWYSGVQDMRCVSTNKSIPAGIVKMAKEYLVRSFWKEIDKLRDWGSMHCEGTSWSSGGALCRMFPKKVLDVLGSIYIQPQASLYDIRNAVTSLHAVVAPTMLESPKWRKNRWDIDQSQFDTFKQNHDRNIRLLFIALENYCMNSANRNHIPNAVEKNILLDIIEVFLIMFGPKDFSDNYTTRQVYEYYRIEDLYVNENTRVKENFREFNSNFTKGKNLRGTGKWDDGQMQIMSILKYLTPEAAICVGVLEQGYSRFAGVVSEAFLKKMNPSPIPEVRLFIHTEASVQMAKINEARYISEKYNRGELTDRFYEYQQECCCAEAPAASGLNY